MTKQFLLLLALCLLLAGCAPQAATTTAPSSASHTQEKPVDLTALYRQMSATLPEMLTVDSEMMLDFCGIQAGDCLQALVAICSVSVRADEVWLLEARDADALARLQTLVQTRLQVKAAEMENYLPDQYEIVKQARVITQGNYLLLLVSPDAASLEAMFREAIN